MMTAASNLFAADSDTGRIGATIAAFIIAAEAEMAGIFTALTGKENAGKQVRDAL